VQKGSVLSTETNSGIGFVSIGIIGKTIGLSGTMANITLMLDDILFLEGSGNYTNVYLNGEQKLLMVCRRLNICRKMLNIECSFFQCHRSYVVSLNKVSGILEKKRRKYLDVQGYKVPLARAKLKEVLTILNKWC
jgi:DNA-binding LytR/AlgR family response regulator